MKIKLIKDKDFYYDLYSKDFIDETNEDKFIDLQSIGKIKFTPYQDQVKDSKYWLHDIENVGDTNETIDARSFQRDRKITTKEFIEDVAEKTLDGNIVLNIKRRDEVSFSLFNKLSNSNLYKNNKLISGVLLNGVDDIHLRLSFVIRRGLSMQCSAWLNTLNRFFIYEGSQIFLDKIKFLDISSIGFNQVVINKDYQQSRKISNLIADNVISMFPNVEVLYLKIDDGFNKGEIELDEGMKMYSVYDLNEENYNNARYFLERILDKLPNLKVLSINLNESKQKEFLPMLNKYVARGINFKYNKEKIKRLSDIKFRYK